MVFKNNLIFIFRLPPPGCFVKVLVIAAGSRRLVPRRDQSSHHHNFLVGFCGDYSAFRMFHESVSNHNTQSLRVDHNSRATMPIHLVIFSLLLYVKYIQELPI